MLKMSTLVAALVACSFVLSCSDNSSSQVGLLSQQSPGPLSGLLEAGRSSQSQQPFSFYTPPPPKSHTDLVRQTSALRTSVFRVICPPAERFGTGWVHRSGRMITAAHVVAACKPEQLEIWSHSNVKLSALSVVMDEVRDLAMVTLKEQWPGGLDASGSGEQLVGDVAVAWGYPWGYLGIEPLLTVGYLAGLGGVPIPGPFPQKIVGRLFVNAAFNAGNSGGPLIDVESKKVIGVVHAKLAPIPQLAEEALRALTSVRSGVMYTAENPQGQKKQFTEGQIVAMVLHHLRGQTQLVVGMAVTLGKSRCSESRAAGRGTGPPHPRRERRWSRLRPKLPRRGTGSKASRA